MRMVARHVDKRQGGERDGRRDNLCQTEKKCVYTQDTAKKESHSSRVSLFSFSSTMEN